MLKFCSKCNVEKSLDNFSKDNSRKDGLQNYCKECRKQRYCNNLDQEKYYSRNYGRENFDKISKYKKEWRKEYYSILENKQKLREYFIKIGRITGTGESVPEKRIREFLEQNQIDFEQEKSFEECRNQNNNLLSFDFYLPNSNICIEFNSLYHFKPVFGEEKLKKQQHNDQVKVDFCKVHNINLIILFENTLEDFLMNSLSGGIIW